MAGVLAAIKEKKKTVARRKRAIPTAQSQVARAVSASAAAVPSLSVVHLAAAVASAPPVDQPAPLPAPPPATSMVSSVDSCSGSSTSPEDKLMKLVDAAALLHEDIKDGSKQKSEKVKAKANTVTAFDAPSNKRKTSESHVDNTANINKGKKMSKKQKIKAMKEAENKQAEQQQLLEKQERLQREEERKYALMSGVDQPPLCEASNAAAGPLSNAAACSPEETSNTAESEEDDDDGSGSGRQSRNSKKSNFAEQLMGILDDEASSDILSWMPDGKSFTISNHRKFTLVCMPKIFNIRNMSSFVRKLTRWGFQRAHDDLTRNSDIFRHNYFQKGRPDLLMKVRCVGKGAAAAAAASEPMAGPVNPTPPRAPPTVVPAAMPSNTSNCQTREDILKECTRQSLSELQEEQQQKKQLKEQQKPQEITRSQPEAISSQVAVSSPLSSSSYRKTQTKASPAVTTMTAPSAAEAPRAITTPSLASSVSLAGSASLPGQAAAAGLQGLTRNSKASPSFLPTSARGGGEGPAQANQALALYRKNLEEQILRRQYEEHQAAEAAAVQEHFQRLEMERFLMLQQQMRGGRGAGGRGDAADLLDSYGGASLQAQAAALQAAQASSLDVATQAALERLSREEALRSQYLQHQHHREQQDAALSMLLNNESAAAAAARGMNGLDTSSATAASMLRSPQYPLGDLSGLNTSSLTNAQLQELLFLQQQQQRQQHQQQLQLQHQLQLQQQQRHHAALLSSSSSSSSHAKHAANVAAQHRLLQAQAASAYGGGAALGGGSANGASQQISFAQLAALRQAGVDPSMYYNM